MSSTRVGTKRVYDFSEGSRDMRDLLGGKGANVAEMTRLGLPVPKGFTITTRTCMDYLDGGHAFPAGLDDEVSEHLATLEEAVGKRLGDPENPLLVSVRSGAKFSMPGMMDTVLNLGLNDQSVEGLAARTSNPRFAYDSYRRFIQMFGDVVAEVKKEHFENALSAMKAARGVEQDVELTADDLRELVETFKGIYREHRGEDFPQEPRAQLDAAIRAVFESWDNRARPRLPAPQPHRPRAGHRGQRPADGVRQHGRDSGTGVAFTRNNVTGEKAEPFGDFLINAQGEDVVAGIRTPAPLAELKDELPEAFAELHRDDGPAGAHLPQHAGRRVHHRGRRALHAADAQRQAQRAGHGAHRRRLVDEGLVSEEEALLSLVDPDQVASCCCPSSTGAAGAARARRRTRRRAPPTARSSSRRRGRARGQAGEPVILVRDETTPDDFHGMVAAQGILTARGGKTSHAAIVAVGMGKPAVCGGRDRDRFADDGSRRRHRGLPEGDRITIDGTSGTVFAGDAPLLPPDPSNPSLVTILGWADRARTLSVRANADTPEDAARAREFGAEGIGLCRTEHMFQAEERLPIVQSMIMAEDADDRRAALHKLRGFQQSDFEGIFRAMAGLPVTIRLLDPPLHEFLPDLVELSERWRAPARRGRTTPRPTRSSRRVQQLHEVNPMLGTRGCRLGIEWPDVYRMQVARHHERRLHRQGRGRRRPEVEIMIPLVGFEEELRIMRDQVDRGGGDRPPRARDEGGVRRRHDDRVAAGGPVAVRDRHARRFLLVRHQRPHPDDARVQPRRRRDQVPGLLPGQQRDRVQPLRDDRSGGRGQAGRDGRGRRPGRGARHQARGSAGSTAATRPR